MAATPGAGFSGIVGSLSGEEIPKWTPHRFVVGKVLNATRERFKKIARPKIMNVDHVNVKLCFNGRTILFSRSERVVKIQSPYGTPGGIHSFLHVPKLDDQDDTHVFDPDPDENIVHKDQNHHTLRSDSELP